MDPLAAVLLRRTGRATVVNPAEMADGAAWVAVLEADVAARGWVLSDDLRSAAARLPAQVRVRWADWLLAAFDEMSGADRPMVPLYRKFPDTPRNTEAVYVRRLLTHLFAVPGAPCVLCGRADGGAPLDPCGHLVCPSCFPADEVSACPICGRRLAADNQYLAIVAPNPRKATAKAPPLPMRLAGLETEPFAAAERLRDELVARPGALSESDREDLRVLVTATAPGRLDWLPEVVPARETSAVVLAWALHAATLTPAYAEVVEAARQRWGTATDAARTLWAYSGGDPGLVLPRPAEPEEVGVVAVPVPRVRALPRALRRAVLALLDTLGAVRAAEDMRRHPAVWKRIGERLHPFAHVAAHPEAAVAFAALRGTRTPRTSPLGAAILAGCAREPLHLTLTEHPDDQVSVRLRTHASFVERALEDGDVSEAARLLTSRPGSLWRRIDHLLRAAGDDEAARTAISAAMSATAGQVSAGVLASAAASLAGRDRTVRATAEQLAATAAARAAAKARAEPVRVTVPATEISSGLREVIRRRALEPETPPGPGIVGGRPGPGMPRRVFFPRGSVVTTWTEPEQRPTLPGTAIAAVRDLVDTELTARAARLPRYDVAVLDAALADVPAPMRERAASDQSAGWPRGSVRDLPPADVLRLFLHWQEPGGTSIDLDLSCAFFDAGWGRVGHCDYTDLRFAGDAAVHSGDLTSAPAPLGATEFLDLDLALLAGAGVRYVVPTVLSFDGVPFETMTEAFAGLMLPARDGDQFDGARVLQRFGLSGNARMMMPMVLDVAERRLLWTDLALPGRGYGHSVDRHRDQMARAAADQWEHFVGGHRTSLLDLLTWHAVGRADRVLIVPADSLPDLSASSVLAAAVDPEALDRLIAQPVGPGSAALTGSGRPREPWIPLSAANLLGELTPPRG